MGIFFWAFANPHLRIQISFFCHILSSLVISFNVELYSTVPKWKHWRYISLSQKVALWKSVYFPVILTIWMRTVNIVSKNSVGSGQTYIFADREGTGGWVRIIHFFIRTSEMNDLLPNIFLVLNMIFLSFFLFSFPTPS